MSDTVTLAARAEQSADPADALRAVVALRERLDVLEARHVDGCLARGWSWAQVGRALRVSKQAAHRRHGRRPPAPVDPGARTTSAADVGASEPRVVITGTARDVVARARREAAALGDRELRPEHLLLALLQSSDGPARQALAAVGIDPVRTRRELERHAPVDPADAPERPAVSSATRSVLEGSLTESQRLCHGHLGPEHLLLALTRDPAGPGARLLLRLGVTADDLEGAVCDVLRRTDFARSL